MKQCPACKNTYTDDSLLFCLADGATLTELGDEQPTLVRAERDQVRVDIPGEPIRREPTAKTEARTNRLVLKVVIGVLLLGLLALVGLGVAGAIFYMNTGSPIVAVKSPTPYPSSSPAPTIDSEKDNLEKELADLQKKLEEQLAPAPSKTPPGFESDELPTARVDSPNDGFLALRSAPDAEKGERLARIPHGTVVVLENCEKEKVTIGARTGRWCMVSYAGQTGWVFDAWLTY